MNWEKRLVEVRILLEKEPTVQRRWVWECRERILEYLVTRYGDLSPLQCAGSQDPDPSPPPLPPRSRKEVEPAASSYRIHRILEEIAQLNRETRKPQSKTHWFLGIDEPNGN